MCVSMCLKICWGHVCILSHDWKWSKPDCIHTLLKCTEKLIFYTEVMYLWWFNLIHPFCCSTGVCLIADWIKSQCVYNFFYPTCKNDMKCAAVIFHIKMWKRSLTSSFKGLQPLILLSYITSLLCQTAFTLACTESGVV